MSRKGGRNNHKAGDRRSRKVVPMLGAQTVNTVNTGTTVVAKTAAKPTKAFKPARVCKIHATAMSAISTPLGGIVKTVAPVVYYAPEAWQTIEYIIDKTVGEIGWLGLVEDFSDEGYYLITEIFIPEQKVSAVTTEMEPEALANLAMQLITEGREDDITKIRYWGHSHVNMRCAPSGTDELQLEEYLDHADWFIRGIYNKKGEHKVDVYNVPDNIIHQCVDNEIITEELTSDRVKALDEILKANVKRPNYGTPRVSVGYNPYRGYGGVDQRSFQELGLDDQFDDPWYATHGVDPATLRHRRIVGGESQGVLPGVNSIHTPSQQLGATEEHKNILKLLNDDDEDQITDVIIQGTMSDAEMADLSDSLSGKGSDDLTAKDHQHISALLAEEEEVYDPDRVFTNAEIYEARLMDPFYVGGY